MFGVVCLLVNNLFRVHFLVLLPHGFTAGRIAFVSTIPAPSSTA